MIFIESLPSAILNEVKMDYCTRIEATGFYTPEEVKEFMLDLPNQYIKDMDVAIDKMLHDYVTAIADNLTLEQLPKLYKVIDTQDELNFEYHTLRTAKTYLQDSKYHLEEAFQ